jgi:uncharacterized protein
VIEDLLLAFGLVFIIEGLFPFVAPEGWRAAFAKAVALPARFIRLGGLTAICLGLLLLLLR